LATLQTCGLLIQVAKPSYTTGTLGEMPPNICPEQIGKIRFFGIDKKGTFRYIKKGGKEA
jgi:hypothetical protein